MVFFFTATLVLSILGLSSVLFLKQWELSTGKVVLGAVRPRIDHFFRALLFWIERVVPSLIRIYSRRALRAALAFVHRAAAALVVYTERMLEQTLQALRRRTDARRLSAQSGGLGQASTFLREVAEHKKKLLRVQDAQTYLHKE